MIIKVGKKLINSTRYSLQGLQDILKEMSFRLEVLYLLISLVALYFIPFLAIEKIVLIVTLLLLLVSEIFNSVIEELVNHLSPNKSEFARKTKDLGSAAVFVVVVATVIEWVWFTVSWLVSP